VSLRRIKTKRDPLKACHISPEIINLAVKICVRC
ncbi:MAG: hypothetical protein ACI9KS_002306, partial [Sulfitobacter sp.]